MRPLFFAMVALTIAPAVHAAPIGIDAQSPPAVVHPLMDGTRPLGTRLRMVQADAVQDFDSLSFRFDTSIGRDAAFRDAPRPEADIAYQALAEVVPGFGALDDLTPLLDR